MRVEKANASGGTLYWRNIAGSSMAESDLTGSTTNGAYLEYVFFAGRRLARRDSSGNVLFYFTDHLGNSHTITNATGTVCYDADFTPYGTEMVHTNTCPQNYKFTGYERDPETGLDYAFARYYSSSLGRFLGADPFPSFIGSPQSENRYTYVMNSPTNLVDPAGLAGGPAYACGDDGWGCGGGGFGAGGGSCTLDGISTFCSIVGDAIGAGGAVQCPENVCSYYSPSGGFVQFVAGAGGATGYLGIQQMPEELNEVNGGFMTNAQYEAYKEQQALADIYAVFKVICRNLGCDPKEMFSVNYSHSAMVWSVQVPGYTVDPNNLDGYWSDPITRFHGGNPSWYSGFFFDTPHLIGSDPISAHIDPFGPLNPLHYLVQLPAMLFPAGQSGTANCSVAGGCNF